MVKYLKYGSMVPTAGDGYYGGANEMRRVDRETYYNWAYTDSLVFTYQPNAIIFSDNGPGCRWVGNEGRLGQ